MKSLKSLKKRKVSLCFGTKFPSDIDKFVTKTYNIRPGGINWSFEKVTNKNQHYVTIKHLDKRLDLSRFYLNLIQSNYFRRGIIDFSSGFIELEFFKDKATKVEQVDMKHKSFNTNFKVTDTIENSIEKIIVKKLNSFSVAFNKEFSNELFSFGSEFCLGVSSLNTYKALELIISKVADQLDLSKITNFVECWKHKNDAFYDKYFNSHKMFLFQKTIIIQFEMLTSPKKLILGDDVKKIKQE